VLWIERLSQVTHAEELLEFTWRTWTVDYLTVEVELTGHYFDSGRVSYVMNLAFCFDLGGCT
jgi:hypothetical protein